MTGNPKLQIPNPKLIPKTNFQTSSTGRLGVWDLRFGNFLGFGIWDLEFLPMFDDLNDLYQEVILDHCKHPRNFHELANSTCSAQGHNPLCGDQLRMFLAMDGETVKDISFVGAGCCISKASASLLTESVKGKTKKEVQSLFDQFKGPFAVLESLGWFHW